MKISIEWPGVMVKSKSQCRVEKDPVVIDVGAMEVTCKDVYVGIGIITESGRFGIAERDGIIEIMHNGKLVMNSEQMKDRIGRIDRLGGDL